MRRSLPEGTSGKKSNRISSFASEMLAILMLSQREIHFFYNSRIFFSKTNIEGNNENSCEYSSGPLNALCIEPGI